MKEPSVAALRAGGWLGGRWLIEGLLGEGGAARVYVAIDRAGNRAAIKVLRKTLAAERVSRARFLREAYVANRIDHPGVARVIEDGYTEDGLPYLAMELLEGETIDQRRARRGGRLPVDEVVWIGDRLLGILAAAHEKDIVHRDVKPENLFLTHHRELKLLDFGIARLAESARITRLGAVLGTLAFMSPEQARGEVDEVGVKSDLWAVGATLYTLFSGVLPRVEIEGPDALEHAANDPVPSLAEAAPDMPREIVDVVDFALSPDPSKRWPSAVTMQRALRRAFVRMRRGSQRLWRSGELREDSEVEMRVDLASIALEPPEVDVPVPVDSLVQRVARDIEERVREPTRATDSLPVVTHTRARSRRPSWASIFAFAAFVLAAIALALTLARR